VQVLVSCWMGEAILLIELVVELVNKGKKRKGEGEEDVGLDNITRKSAAFYAVSALEALDCTTF
jgi:hypothetical protein